MKICWFTNIPSPYRVDFFNELGAFCDLTVVFEAEYAAQLNNKWFSEEIKYFKVVFLHRGAINEKVANLGILKYIKKGKYDQYVLTNYNCPTNMAAILWLKIRRIPFVLEVDGGLLKSDSEIKKTIKSFFIGSATHWLSTSKMTNEYLIYYGAKKENIFVYPFSSLREKDILPFAVHRNEKQKLKHSLGITEDIAILSVGQFIHRKGFDILLKAACHLPNHCGIYIIGGEPTPEYLELQARYNLQNVHFIEFKTQAELREYYKAGDLFVLPTREDIWGLVINEAMASGLPIITTDQCVAGIELVNHANGRIVPAEGIDVLVNAINEVISDEVVLQAMSKKSLEKIRPYTIENMVIRHMKVFEKILTEERV